MRRIPGGRARLASMTLSVSSFITTLAASFSVKGALAQTQCICKETWSDPGASNGDPCADVQYGCNLDAYLGFACDGDVTWCEVANPPCTSIGVVPDGIAGDALDGIPTDFPSQDEGDGFHWTYCDEAYKA